MTADLVDSSTSRKLTLGDRRQLCRARPGLERRTSVDSRRPFAVLFVTRRPDFLLSETASAPVGCSK